MTHKVASLLTNNLNIRTDSYDIDDILNKNKFFTNITKDANEFYFCLISTNLMDQALSLQDENESNALVTNNGFDKFLGFYNNSIFIHFKFLKGLIFEDKFYFPNFPQDKGKNQSVVFKKNVFKVYHRSLASRNESVFINFVIEDCKPGEAFDGISSCPPCLRSTYSPDKINWTLLLCTVCDENNNFYCSKANF